MGSEQRPARECVVQHEAVIERHFAPILIALFLFSFALYAQTLFFELVNFDDLKILSAHPNLYDCRVNPSCLHEIFSGYFPREEPLLVRDLSWALDSWLFGFDQPFGYHLGNVVLNALNVALLFAFLAGTTRRYGFSLVTAFVFGILPVHAEPVSWVMGRKDVLSVFFMLCALCAQTKSLSSEGRSSLLWYALTVPLIVLACLSKISAVVGFALLALHRIFWPALKGNQSAPGLEAMARRVVRIGAALAPHAILSFAIFFWYRDVLTEWGILGHNPSASLHAITLLEIVPVALMEYAKLLLLPSTYTVLYARPSVSLPPSTTELIAAYALLCAIATLALVLYRKRDSRLFYLLGFAIIIAPYCGFAYVGIWVASRYIYFASFFVVALLISAGMDLHARSPRAIQISLLGAFALLCAVNVARTLSVQNVWRNTEALWTYDAGRASSSLSSHARLTEQLLSSAHEAPTEAMRSKYQERAEAATRRGLATFESRAYQTRPGYEPRENIALARLYAAEAELLALRGAAAEVSLAKFELARSVDPNSAFVNEGAARAYWKAASEFPSGHEERERLARKSIQSFEAHVRRKSADPLTHAANLEHLSDFYWHQFPGIQPGLRKMAQLYWGADMPLTPERGGS
jgi:hypothetical protein